MIKKITLAMIAIVAIVLTGCNKAATTPGVAVLDLDRVAAAIGWDQSFKDSLSEKDQSLGDRVNQARQSLEGELKNLQQSMGDDPTQEERTQLAQFQQQASSQYQKLVNSARAENAEFRQELVRSFRDKVRPYAEEVAKESGFGMVLLETDPVYLVMPEADITNEVIQAMEGVIITAELPGETGSEKSIEELGADLDMEAKTDTEE